MAALRYDLIVDQGADYRRDFPVLDDTDQPVSVTGWSVAGQIRAGAGSAAVLEQLDVTAAHGHAEVRIPAATSAAWSWRLARFDIELTDLDGAVTRFVEGFVVVRPETTRSA